MACSLLAAALSTTGRKAFLIEGVFVGGEVSTTSGSWLRIEFWTTITLDSDKAVAPRSVWLLCVSGYCVCLVIVFGFYDTIGAEVPLPKLAVAPRCHTSFQKPDILTWRKL